MHDEYDSQGDVVMRDASLPDTAMDQLAVRFSRFSLVDPPIHRVSDDVLYELFMSLGGEPPAENCDFIVLLSHVCQNWRSIIVRAPLLRKFVAMYSSGSLKDHSSIVQSFLHRSQDQSITFAVYLRKAPLSKSPFARILRPHAPRVRILRFTACSFPTLWSHLVDLSSLCLTSLEKHEAVVRWGRRRTPGSFTAISRASKQNFRMPPFVPTAVPTWPYHLDITSLSFMYSSLKLLDIFLIVEMSRSTLQHLKIYFQNRHNVIHLTHWLLMDDPPIDLPELRSMDLGYNDPLSLVPFLHCVRLPSLESLSIHDFSSCPEPDTPKADIVPLPAPPALPPSTPSARPLDCFLAALVAAIPAPELLASLRLTGLDCFGSTSLEHALDYLGPDVRSLYISKCSPEMLEALKSSIGCGDFRWSLEHLTIRGMDTDELMGCLWIRHAILHGRLELVCLERPLSCREVLLEEVDEDCTMYF